MTTEQTQFTTIQHGDADEAVAEQQPVSESMPNPASPEVVIPSEAQTDEHDQGQAPHQLQDPAMNQGSAFSFTEAIPLIESDVTRPFTDFIEEFRQAEEARVVPRFIEGNSSLRESTEEPLEGPGRQEFITSWENISFESQPSIV